MSKNKTIFRIEKKVLEDAQAVIMNEAYHDQPLFTEFKILFEHYIRIYKQFQSMIRISDHQQNHLNELNKKLTESNTSKDKFFSIISHDLRGPLASLIGLSELLQEKIKDNDHKDDISNLANHVCSSAKDLHTLLENLLTWSRIQRGMIEYRLEEIEIKEIIKFNIRLFTPQADQKQITLKSSAVNGILIYADYNVINTVLRNIISNAIKFTPTGGIINISILQYDDETVELSVSDTGIGISQKNISDLFRIGSQCSQTGTAGERGTGLGLILCKELLEKSRGTIHVESRIGKGTSVRLRLPGKIFQKSEPSAVTVSEESKTPVSEYRMLVVDDAPINRQILVAILSSFGFRCREAGNGQEALDIWKTWQPHLIWMDINMPVMNGYDAAKHIKESEKGENTLIIAITGGISESEQRSALAIGYKSIINKPFNKDEIIRIIRKYLNISDLKEKDHEKRCREKNNMIISDHIKKYFPEIINKLQNEIFPRWRYNKEIVFIDEFADFTSEIRDFAFEYQLDFLYDDCQNLYNFMQDYNITAIEKYIPKIFKTIDEFIKKMRDAERSAII